MADEAWETYAKTLPHYISEVPEVQEAFQAGQASAVVEQTRENEAKAIEKYARLVEDTSKLHAYAMDEDDWDETKRLLDTLRDYAKAIREGKL